MKKEILIFLMVLVTLILSVSASVKDSVDFSTNIAEMKGHLDMAVLNLENDNRELAFIHTRHPVEEYWVVVGGIIKEKDSDTFNAIDKEFIEILRVSEALSIGKDVASIVEFKAKVKRINDLLDRAEALVIPEQIRTGFIFKAKVIISLMEAAEGEYSEGVDETGKVKELAEYQDSVAFFNKAERVYKEIRDAIDEGERTDIDLFFKELNNAVEVKKSPSEVETIANGIIHEVEEVADIKVAEEKGPADIIDEIKVMLQEIIEEYERQEYEEAEEIATKAYLEKFELIEQPLGSIDPELNEELEHLIREQLRQEIKNRASAAEIKELVSNIINKLEKAQTGLEKPSKEVKEANIASEIKEIGNLLKLVEKEYTEAVKDGEIIDQREYDEAKIFLESAHEKYKVIEKQIKETNPEEYEEIELFFTQLDEKIDSKAEPLSVSSIVMSLGDELSEVSGEKEKGKIIEGRVETTLSKIKELVEKSVKEYKAGNSEKSASIARDAFILFEEEIGKEVSSKDSALEDEIESGILKLSTLMKASASMSEIEGEASKVYLGLEKAERLLTAETNPLLLFIQSLTIIVREGFEALIIVSAIVAYLRVSGNKDKIKIIYKGAILAVIASLITAWLIEQVFHLGVASQEILEGVTMLIAVLVLFYVSYWLISKVETKRWQKFIEGKIRDAITAGNQFILGSVAFFAVYREGFETVLFYKALFIGAPEGSYIITLGFGAGIILLALIFWIFYKYSVKIPVKQFFIVTSIILYYMSFTFMGNGIAELQEGGAVSMTPLSWAPNIPFLGMYPTVETFVGQMTLIIVFVFSLAYVFVIQPMREKREIIKDTEHIVYDLGILHNIVEDIREHVKRCTTLSIESSREEIMETSEHIKQIDGKIHELLGHLKHMKEVHLTENNFNEITQKPMRKSKES